ncbi:MAG: VIT1/CCC1 transporter family protein [Anaerolineae bacterium]
MALSAPEIQNILRLQQEEITGHHIYLNLAERVKDANNAAVLQRIAAEEMKHYTFWKAQTGQDVAPEGRKVRFYTTVARLFGLTFGIKLMEQSEEAAQAAYNPLLEKIPGVDEVLREEEEHEDALLAMLDEDWLKYAGSVVLGLNDALVELTGALAGLTFALQDTGLVALSGLITGISASLSMAASEYLSTRSEAGEQEPGKAALYTGIAYVITVIALILPFLIVPNIFVSLGLTLLVAILIIAVFNFYIAVARGEPFRRRFVEMAVLSMGVAALSFVIGVIVRNLFGIEI